MANDLYKTCEVGERDEYEADICFTEFETWECDGPGACYEQSLRLTYGEDKYPFNGGTGDDYASRH